MTLIFALALMADGKPWEKYQRSDTPPPQAVEEWWEKDSVVSPKPEVLGSGPHTLVISDGAASSRMEYKTGQQCQKARNEIRRQVKPVAPPGAILAPPRVQAFCVPR
jgi:hypothetical protein